MPYLAPLSVKSSSLSSLQQPVSPTSLSVLPLPQPECHDNSHPPTYSPLSPNSSFSTRFLTKEPRGFPLRSSNPCSPESDASSLDSSDYSSSESSSVSSASSYTHLASADQHDDPFYSKLAQIELAAQALTPAMPFSLPTSGSSTSLSTIVPSPPSSSASTSLSSLALLSKKSPATKPVAPPSHVDDTAATIPRRKSSLKLVRHSSMPATSKMVHFDVNLEEVRHFLHSEKPAAVSACSSPLDNNRAKFHWGTDSESSSDTDDDEDDPRLGYQRYLDRTQWQISLPNFTPNPDRQDVVFVENLFLTSDKNKLIGHIAVKNIAFEKHVAVKYTFDNWKTITELPAEYNDDLRRKRRDNGYDRFTFAINMADLPQHAASPKSLFFCVRYATNNQEFWDNNSQANYQVDFSRVSRHKNNALSHRLPTRVRRANSADCETRPSFDGVDVNDIFGPLHLTSKDKRAKNQFASRYDFGASFSTPTKKTNRHKKPAQLALNAKSYQELIDSYCFFGAKPSNPAASSPSSPGPQTADHHQAHPHVWKGFGVSV